MPLSLTFMGHVAHARLYETWLSCAVHWTCASFLLTTFDDGPGLVRGIYLSHIRPQDVALLEGGVL